MDIRPHPRKSPIERLLALVEVVPGQCWPWLGSKTSDGYGRFVVDGRRGHRKTVAPYRFLWEHFNGPMAEGLEPDHTCNNRDCCNPEHVEPVTHAENQRRAYRRGRKRPGVDYKTGRPRRSHCPHGHEYTVENIRTSSQGSIQCKTCDRARCATYQAKRRRALIA